MVTTEADITAPTPPRRALVAAALLLIGELAAIGLIFKHSISFNCHENWSPGICSAASGTLVAVYCMLAALFLFYMFYPSVLRALFQQAGSRSAPLAMNLAGVALALVPVTFLRNGAGTDVIAPAFSFWISGMALLLGGVMLYLAPMPRWLGFLRVHGMTIMPMLAAAAATPWLAMQIRPLWRLETISQITFDAVTAVVRSLGYQVNTPENTKVIGEGDFYINVAPACSGVEGFALVTVFVSLYLWLFRQDLRFPRALLLFPIGLMASALFNVLRIAILLIIGLEGNPELAVGGFHSHAGWLMFTLVALGIVGLAQTVPALQKAAPAENSPSKETAPALPLLQDPVVAQILPFAIFMFSALLAQVFASSPGVVYPLRVLAMGAALALFLPLYRRLDWQLDGVAIGAGALVGLMWVLIPVDATESAPYGTLAGGLLIGWFILRGVGTILFVPVIEELFFRGYLERRLRFGGGLRWRLLAALITACLFAALHDRWMEALVAGLVFSWVMARRGSVVDAIVAHAAANALVYAVALATGNLSII
ncbi:exosortase E/protease, VPEID-CTERM system [uncultured Roseobacter sp.]|uniref:exosortase E/protease, VPEID-CTERM system n=1 Tax=uncultured Roseobacter sp. TaxID=114847 RepID=UPI00262CF621|nr:exosortase E/protease, VPEID-CTERM system [uncultured Roseobacter sp.]